MCPDGAERHSAPSAPCGVNPSAEQVAEIGETLVDVARLLGQLDDRLVAAHPALALRAPAAVDLVRGGPHVGLGDQVAGRQLGTVLDRLDGGLDLGLDVVRDLVVAVGQRHPVDREEALAGCLDLLLELVVAGLRGVELVLQVAVLVAGTTSRGTAAESSGTLTTRHGGVDDPGGVDGDGLERGDLLGRRQVVAHGKLHDDAVERDAGTPGGEDEVVVLLLAGGLLGGVQVERGGAGHDILLGWCTSGGMSTHCSSADGKSYSIMS